jgi:hypothetical protein
MRQFKVLLVLIILVSISTPFVSGQDWISWTEHPDNPVLDPDSRAYYPCVVYDVNMFDGAGFDAPYKVWYQTETGISHAYSLDGEDWIITGGVTGLVSTASHPCVMYDPDGFGDGVFYKMWYWTGIGEITTVNSIHYAESNDGLIWFNDQAITQDATYPLVTAVYGTWWYHLYGPCCLLYIPDAFNVGDNPYDYSYVMFFDTAYEGGGPDGIETVGLAYSVDGKHWIRYGDEPIIYPSDGEWDGEYVTRGTVFELPFDGYGFWYSGGVSDSNDGIGYAESVDGLQWVKSDSNPILHQDDTGYPGYPWRSDRSYTPMVIYDQDSFSGNGPDVSYKMWYSGKNPDNSEYTVGVTYGMRQVPVGGELAPVDPVEIVLPLIVSVVLLVIVFLYRRRI